MFFSSLLSLWKNIENTRYGQIATLFFLIIISAFFEMLSIGAIFPFLKILINPEVLTNSNELEFVKSALGTSDSNEIILLITILFISSIVLAAVFRMSLLYMTINVSKLISSDLSYKIYRNTLSLPYSYHINDNGSEKFVDLVVNKVSAVVYNVINPALMLIGSIVIFTAIMAVMMIVDFLATASIVAFLSLTYGLIVYYSRKKILVNSKVIAYEEVRVIKSLQEGLGGIRDVIINNNQNFYCDIFKKSYLNLRSASSKNVFMGSAPRFIVEALGIVFLAIAAYLLSKSQGGVLGALPVLGVIAIGLQRLLPILQQGYQSWTLIKGSHSSLRKILEDESLSSQSGSECQHDTSGTTDLLSDFNSEIRVKNLGFKHYSSETWAFRHINFVIKKGETVGLMGVTGSGKSTLMDIVMGLLPATEGSVEVDGIQINEGITKMWQRHISHVPQSIFLTNASIEENVAFGVPRSKVNKKHLADSIQSAQLEQFLNHLPKGVDTLVGERGVKLSGGQRQRIGIARALYRKPNVIFFDESTSALDNETEKALMKTIKNMKKEATIFIIAHRLTTLKDCDSVYSLNKDGSMNKVDIRKEIDNF